MAVHIEADFADFDRARYVLRHAGEEETFVVDTRAAGNGWVELGRFDFDGEGDEYLALYDNYMGPVGGDLRRVADAIRVRLPGTPEDAGVSVGDAGVDADVDADVLDGNALDGSVADGALLGGADGGGEASDDGGCGYTFVGHGTGVPSGALLFALILSRRRLRA